MTESPHYVLLSESDAQGEAGRWRFVLRAADGAQRLTADEVEPDVRGERLELLAVVRGLEALDQPSHVTLLTASDYVRTGLRFGLAEWRRNGWQWEYFGEMVPIKNGDLWQRVDRAMRFHRVECRNLRLDPPHALSGKKNKFARPHHRPAQAAASATSSPPPSDETAAPHQGVAPTIRTWVHRVLQKRYPNRLRRIPPSA